MPLLLFFVRFTSALSRPPNRRLKEQAERQARAQEYREATWVTEQGDASGSASEEEDPFLDYEVQPFTCLVCDKFFKSQAALDNHARWGPRQLLGRGVRLVTESLAVAPEHDQPAFCF